MQTLLNTHHLHSTASATVTTCTVCAWCSTLISDGLLHDGYLSHGICLDCEALLAANDEELRTLAAAACS
jgi:hypothetical protein